MLGKISLQYESSYKNISTAKFYFKWLSLLYPTLLHFYFLRHTHWKNGKNCHLSSFYLFLQKKKHSIYREAAIFFSTTMNKSSKLSFVPAFLVYAEDCSPHALASGPLQGAQQFPGVNGFGLRSGCSEVEVWLCKWDKSAADANKKGSFKTWVKDDFAFTLDETPSCALPCWCCKRCEQPVTTSTTHHCDCSKSSPAGLKSSAAFSPVPVRWSHGWARQDPNVALFPKEPSSSLHSRVSLHFGLPTRLASPIQPHIQAVRANIYLLQWLLSSERR